VLAAELAGHELAGLDELAAFGATLYGDRDPASRLAAIEPLRVDAVGKTMVLSVHLPFTERNDVSLGRSEEELFLTVGPHRRAFLLPDSLLRREVTGARLAGDRLEVEFV
jgi:arsenite-transporting ATPase